jgi:hypothetical protein
MYPKLKILLKKDDLEKFIPRFLCEGISIQLYT